MKILVVEDEKKIASFVRKGLEAQGFVVEVSHDNEAYALATTRPYDALGLDIMLPGRDGLSTAPPARGRPRRTAGLRPCQPVFPALWENSFL